MRSMQRLIASAVCTALAGFASVASAAVSGFNSIGVLNSHPWSGMDSASLASNDPPGNFFPGKYFEYKTQFYLKKKDYREALTLFELAGFWANKIAQYNAGLMYYNGIGVAVDKVRGVAWLGIAAEEHDDLAVRALQTAYASLNPSERIKANSIWKDLDQKYGDAVTLSRALQRYDVEAKSATGSHVGFVGNLRVFETAPGNNPLGESGFGFYRRQQDVRDALIDRITGHVSVGAVRPLKVDDDAKKNASRVPLTDQPAGSPP